MKNILFINDTYDDNNLGCKATTLALYNLLSKRKDLRLSDIIKLYHTERGQMIEFLPSAHLDDFRKKAQECANPAIDPSHAYYYELDKIRRNDIILINGEGSIYKDVIKCRYQLFLAFCAKSVFNKKVFIINHTADITHVFEIAKYVYSIIDGSCARECETYQALKNINAKNVHLVPDAVFSFHENSFRKFQEPLPFGFTTQKPYIMVGGSSLNHPIYEQWYGKWDVHSFLHLLNDILQHFDHQILLADVGGDSFLREFDRLGRVFYGKFTYNDYALLAKKASAHISGRHHGSCLAAISGCPLIGFSANTYKMEGDFKLFDWKMPVYDFYSLEKHRQDIIDSLRDCIIHNKQYRQYLKQKVFSLRSLVDDLVNIIS